MIKIIRTDISNARLTLSKDENRLKIPYDYSDYMVERLKAISEIIEQEVKDYDKTLRGRFNSYYENIFIDMKDCNKNIIKSYKFDIE